MFLIPKVINMFSNFPGSHCVLDRSSPTASDVCNDILGLPEHPVVAPGDSVVWVNGLDPFREHGVRVVVVFCLLARYIGQHNGVIDLRIFLFHFLQLAMHIGIKLALMAHIEHVHIVVSYQIYKNLS